MTPRYLAVIFDLDGTLLNTLFDLTDAVNHTMSEFDYPLHTLDEVRSFVGNGIIKLILRSLPEEHRTENEVNSAYQAFLAYYNLHCADKTVPYEGITALIEKLHQQGIPMSVVSNKDDLASRMLCDKFFHDKFVCVLGAKPDLPRKPDPAGALFAARKMGISPSKIAYVGDSDVDVKTARNSGMGAISVCWGFRSEELLQSLAPDKICKNTDQLYNAIIGD